MSAEANNNKMPYMQFYVNDWLSDTAMLSPATKGIWIDILAIMHIRRTGTITANIDKLSRACRCRISEMESALNEINAEKIADIDGCYGNVTEMFSITCRRMQRLENERSRAKEAMKKSRAKTQCYGDVTELLQECDGDVTPYISESESEYINKKNIIAPTHTHACDARKESKSDSILDMSKFETVDAILEIAASAHCGMACTREQAEAYLADRMAGDWFDPMRRKIKPGRVAADLKNFLLRQEEKKQKQQQFNVTKGVSIYADGKHLARSAAEYGESDSV